MRILKIESKLIDLIKLRIGGKMESKRKSTFDLKNVENEAMLIANEAEQTAKKQLLEKQKMEKGNNYVIFENKILFYVKIKEKSNAELVCLDDSEVPQFIHVMLNNEEIEVETTKREYPYLTSNKTIMEHMIGNPSFINAYGEYFYKIQAVDEKEGILTKIVLFTSGPGMKKIVFLDLTKTCEVEFYDNEFVRIRLDRETEYVIKDTFVVERSYPYHTFTYNPLKATFQKLLS